LLCIVTLLFYNVQNNSKPVMCCICLQHHAQFSLLSHLAGVLAVVLGVVLFATLYAVT